MSDTKPKAVIFDIDDTLSDTDHRQHLAETKQWSAFYASLKDDKPMATIDILKALYNNDYKIILLTGRPEIYKEATVTWLCNHFVPYHELHMRPVSRQYVKDSMTKLKIYEQSISPKYDVIAVFEDRKQCVDMWRKIGLLCFQPKESNF